MNKLTKLSIVSGMAIGLAGSALAAVTVNITGMDIDASRIEDISSDNGTVGSFPASTGIADTNAEYLSDGGSNAGGASSVSYAFEITSMTIDGTADIQMNFDLVLSASTGNVALNGNGSEGLRWTINSASGSDSRIDGSEELTFDLQNATFINNTDGRLVRFIPGTFSTSLVGGQASNVGGAGITQVGNTFSGTPTNGNFNIDGVTFSFQVETFQIPEPTTLGLLMMGGLVARSVRRRK